MRILISNLSILRRRVLEVLSTKKREAEERAAAEAAAARAEVEAQAEARRSAALEASARRRQAFLSSVCFKGF